VNSPDLFERVATALAAEYEIVRLLGQGGMATVFLAREKALKRLVALKVLSPDLSSPAFRTRFVREAETAAQLQHPHIVPIFRVGEAGGLSYYAMGFVDGETLADRLSREKALSRDDALRIGSEVAAALGAAHRRGIIHRDVKPQNIMLESESGRALVTDFGIARVVPAATAGTSETDTDRLTAMGMVMGTPRYMSPEQAMGERDLTPAADMYSLGIILYEMLTGRYPYSQSRGSAAMMAHLNQVAAPIEDAAPDLPPRVAHAVGALLDKTPEHRPGPAALRAALGDRFAEPTEVMYRPSSKLRRRLIIALAIGLSLGAVFAALRGTNRPPGGVDPRKSILVGFFDNTSNDPALQWLRMGGVDLLTQSLRRWQDLQVVEVDRLLDLTREAGFSEERRLSQDGVIALARDAGVWTAATGSLVPIRDSIRVNLNVYDVASGKQLRSASATAPLDDPGLAFQALASEILDLSDAPQASLIEVDPPTRSLAAYRAYLDGIVARNRWSLDSAGRAFRRAIQLDSTFALAYYELSIAVYVNEVLTTQSSFIGLSDSALMFAQRRPPRERQLIEAYNALVHSDFDRARRIYHELLARDSSLSDAWNGLGAAAQLDLTLRKDERGREILPMAPTLARRSYESAIRLDPDDHRAYANLANVIAFAALDNDAAIPGFRQPPPGGINTLGDRFPVRFYSLLLVGDSMVVVPSDSLRVRYPKPVIDSLRRGAREQLRRLLDRWMRVAPGEGQAYMLKAEVEKLDQHYDQSIAALREAERLGAISVVPFPYQRLGLLLLARRLEDAADLGDSLNRSPAAPENAFLRSGPVNASFLRGRLRDGDRGMANWFAAGRALTNDPEVRSFLDFAEPTAPVRIRASAGVASRASIAQMETGLRGLRDRVNADTRSSWENLARLLVFTAATAGDTAVLNRWTTDSPRPDFKALGYAMAGDRSTAERFYQSAARDTGTAAMHRFAMGQVAELLGRPAEALRYYTALDSSNFEAGVPDVDWILLVRSLAARGALYEAVGDLAQARQFYTRFLALWKDADPELQPQVNRVRRALGQLERQDSPDK
jgi:serine/threonine-protein kinase